MVCWFFCCFCGCLCCGEDAVRRELDGSVVWDGGVVWKVYR